MSEPVFWLSDGVFWLGGGPAEGNWLEPLGVRPQWIDQVHCLDGCNTPIALPRAEVHRWAAADLDRSYLIHLLALALAKKEFHTALLVEDGHSLLLANTYAVGRYNLLPRAGLSVRLPSRTWSMDEKGIDTFVGELAALELDTADLAVASAPQLPALLQRLPSLRLIVPYNGLLARISAVALSLENSRSRLGLVVEPVSTRGRFTLIERIGQP